MVAFVGSYLSNLGLTAGGLKMNLSHIQGIFQELRISRRALIDLGSTMIPDSKSTTCSALYAK